MGIQQMLMAVSNAVQVPGGTVTGTYNSADSYVLFYADGTTATTAGAGANWFTPTTPAVGDGYYIRFTKQSGDGTLVVSHSDWGVMSGTTSASIDKFFKATAVVLVEISSDSGGSTIVASGTYTLTVA